MVSQVPEGDRGAAVQYLAGMSSGDFVPALEGFFGNSAGLSASVITRLTTQWQDEHRHFSARSLKGKDFVYVWVDGVHFNVRLAEDRLCVLVMVGVRLDGTKELVAIRDEYSESKESLGGSAPRPQATRDARPGPRHR